MTVLTQFDGTISIGGVEMETRNDLRLDANGVLSLTSGKDAYGYVIADAIRTLKGELQLDIEQGINYQWTVWKSTANVTEWKTLVRRRVRQFDFVSTINSFDTVVSDGGAKLAYTLQIKLKSGDTITVTNIETTL